MAKTTSSFNSDRTIRQYAQCLLLESPFVRSSTDHLAVRAFIWQTGRLGGRRGETGSRNMTATPKINFLTLVSYSLLQTGLAKTYRFATNPQYKTSQTTDDRQTTQCTKGSTDSTVGQKPLGQTVPDFCAHRLM